MDAELSHYADLIAGDANLRGVASLAELHARLATLSAALTEADAADSVFQQLTFPTEVGSGHPSPVFEPNRFKKDMSTDGIKIGQHYRYAVKSAEHVVQALEYACETEPSLILPADEASGTGAGPGRLRRTHTAAQTRESAAKQQKGEAQAAERKRNRTTKLQ